MSRWRLITWPTRATPHPGARFGQKKVHPESLFLADKGYRDSGECICTAWTAVASVARYRFGFGVRRLDGAFALRGTRLGHGKDKAMSSHRTPNIQSKSKLPREAHHPPLWQVLQSESVPSETGSGWANLTTLGAAGVVSGPRVWARMAWQAVQSPAESLRSPAEVLATC